MKALSLTQPYAEIIRNGTKKIETRSWKTNYRGRIYIHATSGKPVKDPALMNLVKGKDLDYGKIICSANLVDCVEMTAKFIEDLKQHNKTEYICGIYEIGRYAWILEDVQPVEPFEIKGHLGIWNFEMEGANMKNLLEYVKKHELDIKAALYDYIDRDDVTGMEIHMDNPGFYPAHYTGDDAPNVIMITGNDVDAIYNNYLHKLCSPKLYAMEYKVYTDEDLTGIDCVLHPSENCRIDVMKRDGYALISIIAEDPERELDAQLSDGVFENIRITEVKKA